MDISLSAVAELETTIGQEAAELMFLRAHTAHAFTDQEVTDRELETVYDLMKMAPTAMNSQPLRITWVRSQQAREKLVAGMNDGNKAKTLAAPVSAILSVDNNWHRHIGLTAPHAIEQQPFFESNAQVREGMAQKSAWIQVGYFILAARAVGLDAGPMTGFTAEAIDQTFHATSGHRVLAVVNLGHASEEGVRPRAGRLEYAEATTTI